VNTRGIKKKQWFGYTNRKMVALAGKVADAFIKQVFLFMLLKDTLICNFLTVSTIGK
jgi:hypothetical protein